MTFSLYAPCRTSYSFLCCSIFFRLNGLKCPPLLSNFHFNITCDGNFRSTSSHKGLISPTHLAMPNKEILLDMFTAGLLSTIMLAHPFHEPAFLSFSSLPRKLNEQHDHLTPEQAWEFPRPKAPPVFSGKPYYTALHNR